MASAVDSSESMATSFDEGTAMVLPSQPISASRSEEQASSGAMRWTSTVSPSPIYLRLPHSAPGPPAGQVLVSWSGDRKGSPIPCLFLPPERAYITGMSIAVDGGW